MDEPVASEDPSPAVASSERRSSGTPVRASAAWAAKRSELFAARQRIAAAHQHDASESGRGGSKGGAQEGDASAVAHTSDGSADQGPRGSDPPAAASKHTSSPGSSAASPPVLTFSVADVKSMGFGAQAQRAEHHADAARVAATHRAPLRLAFEAARKQSGGAAPVEAKKVVASASIQQHAGAASHAPATPHRPVAVAALRPPRVSVHGHVKAPTPPIRTPTTPSGRPQTAEATTRPRRIVAPTAPAHPSGSSAMGPVPMAPRARRASTTGVAPREEDPNDAVTRTNFDKRTCRRTHAGEFAAAIALWRRQRGLPQNSEAGGTACAADVASSAEKRLSSGHSNKHALPHARICLRKRPLFPGDTARGEFDCVTIPKPGACVVHVCSMRPDLRRMFLRNVTCTISAGGGSCFSDAATDEEVYSAACAPLVAAALEGSPAAVFMFGQTGSGKTHTMGAFQRLAAERVLPTAGASDAQTHVKSVVIEYFEIAGKTARDLLVAPQLRSSSTDAAAGGEDTHPGMILVRDAPTSSAGVELVGATSRAVTSAAQLLEVIAEGTRRRATRATAMNADSSRSHAVLRLHLMDAQGRTAGSLTMVDCAGSERKEDSFAHDAAQRKEGAYINASLYALKECMRARAKAASAPQRGAAASGAAHVHVPYRSSLLTRMLAECLTCSHAALCVVGTLSPDASDAEHSISTMQAVSMLAAGDVAGHCAFSEANEDVAIGLTMDDVLADGPLSNPGKLSQEALAMQRVQRIPPVQWKAADLGTWLRRTHNGAFAGVAGSVPGWMAGRDVARMSAAAMTATLCGGDAKLADKLHVAFREAVTRAAAAKAAK